MGFCPGPDQLNHCPMLTATMQTSSPTQFSFQGQDVLDHLLQSSREMLSGYWQFCFSSGSTWYLAVVQGRLVFLGKETLTWEALQGALKRFIPALRTPAHP